MKTKILFLLLSLSLAGAKTLSEAYSLALQNNSELKQGEYENMASSQRLRATWGALLPNISADASYVMEKYRPRNSQERVNESYVKYGVSLNQAIFRVPMWYETGLAKLRDDSENLRFQGTKQDLAKKVTQAYFNYAYDLKSLSVAKSYEAANAARYARFEKLLNMGLSNKMDTLEAKVRLDEASLEVAKAKRKIELSKLALSRLVGQDIDVSDFGGLDISFFKREALDKFDDVESNLDYKQSKIAREYYDKDYKKRLSEYLPSIDLNVGYYNHNYRDDRRFKDELNKIEGMIKISMPLYSGGSTKARVEEGRLMRLASAEKEADTRREIEIRQREARSDYLGYISEYEIATSSLEHANIYAKSIERGYEEGLKNLVDLLDAKARVFKANNDALAAALKLVLSYIELYSQIAQVSDDMMFRLQSAIK